MLNIGPVEQHGDSDKKHYNIMRNPQITLALLLHYEKEKPLSQEFCQPLFARKLCLIL